MMESPSIDLHITPPVVASVIVDRALRLLHEASRCAHDVCAPPWEFAVNLHALKALGLTESAVRWLIAKNVLDHRVEIVDDHSEHRVFRAISRFRLSEGSCFILTDVGLRQAEEILVASEQHSKERHPCSCIKPDAPPTDALPKWDPDRKELTFGGLVVKRFKVQSPNQEIVLSAFEEEHWPSRIDDPLIPVPNQPPKRRLHDTIKNLNRNQRRRLLKFEGDGTGLGVLWGPVDTPAV